MAQPEARESIFISILILLFSSLCPPSVLISNVFFLSLKAPSYPLLVCGRSPPLPSQPSRYIKYLDKTRSTVIIFQVLSRFLGIIDYRSKISNDLMRKSILTMLVSHTTWVSMTFKEDSLDQLKIIVL